MKPFKTLLASLLVAGASLHALPALSQGANDMTDGEVRKVDKAAGRVTLKHGDIRNLGMPGMTMVFGVRDKALLEPLKPGDKVRFTAVSEKDQLIVTAIQPVK